eukprot:CAMPEP_0201728766 /NCGR_PEP_ID=MMETSP0593-20130828/17089_1 /ASSEMBLY_ACC=CAM_ASM_000672 /TAXON_ID=267983 /ORGANISM="Skeletonema japonicum, Strain CCMP2506" /LENGTH=288 /DNA_ID=CAMNT_0048220983 /DNA_START=52 /DNA_END=915 /DNA_ORIENTATION=+
MTSITTSRVDGSNSPEHWKQSSLGRQLTVDNNMGSVANVIPNVAEQRGNDDASSTSSTKMVQWRGNLVDEKEAKALRHVFDDLQDHFGHQRPDPQVKFEVSLEHPGHGQMWQADIDFTYNIRGDHCKLAYIGMDMCLDLTPKLIHKFGRPMLQGYGETWAYAYLPESTMEKIRAYVKAGTGWDVFVDGAVHDPNRNLVAIKAKLNNQDGQPKPSFWVVSETDSAQDDVSFSRIGAVQEVHNDATQKHIHRGVGIFSVTMEVEGTPNFKPNPLNNEANLVFTLVSVRTW